MASKNWGLQVPTKTTPLTPLATPFALLASSISDALTAVLSGSARRGTAAQRDAFYGTPTSSTDQLALQGSKWYNTTTGLEETYYAAYSGSNKRGSSTAGWSAYGAIVNLSPASDKLTASSGTFHVSRQGGWARMHGYLNKTDGQFPSGNTTLLTIPDGFRPRDYLRWAGQYYQNNSVSLSINTGGVVVLTQGSGTSADVIYLDGPPWEVA